jgi:hypothetical protein
MVKGHLGEQCDLQVSKFPLPVSAALRKLDINPDSQTEQSTTHVISLTQLGEVQVTDAIVLIKANEKSPIADRNISGHGYPFAPFIVQEGIK